MSKFVLRTTTDGMKHLYLDDPDREGFLKLAQNKKAKLFKYDKCAILSDGEGYVKTLFGFVNNKVFHVELPDDAKIDFINYTCIFERKSEWCSINFLSDSWNEVVLGKRHDLFLPCQYVMKYNCIDWIYFLRKEGQKVILSHIVDEVAVVLGAYLDVRKTRFCLMAQRDDEGYDMFVPKSVEPVKGNQNEIFDVTNGIYIWSDERNAWVFHQDCRRYASNAIYRIINDDDYRKIEVYRVDNKEISLMLEATKWSWNNNPCGICINDMIYIFDVETGILDFENPKPTFKKKIKNFFKLK